MVVTKILTVQKKREPTNVGRIALEQQAGVEKRPAWIPTIDLPIHNYKHCPLGYQALMVALLQPILY